MTTKRECSEKAYHHLGNWGQWDPCSRKATVERDGKWYCWQHDPERVEADKKKRRASEDAKQNKRSAMYARRARNARLATLVTPELAALLEALATHVPYTLHTGIGIATQARDTAASIREALALEGDDEG